MEKFCLHDTNELLSFAIEAARVVIKTEVDHVTQLHGSVYGIQCILEKIQAQLDALPEELLDKQFP